MVSIFAISRTDLYPVGFLISRLIMRLLRHIFLQVANSDFQLSKSRGRIFCVFSRPLLLQSKSLRPLLPGEFAGRWSETHLHKRKMEILRSQAKWGFELKFTPKTKKPTQRLVGGEAKKWSGWRGSNPRLSAPKADALSHCATPRRIGNKVR